MQENRLRKDPNIYRWRHVCSCTNPDQVLDVQKMMLLMTMLQSHLFLQNKSQWWFWWQLQSQLLLNTLPWSSCILLLDQEWPHHPDRLHPCYHNNETGSPVSSISWYHLIAYKHICNSHCQDCGHTSTILHSGLCSTSHRLSPGPQHVLHLENKLDNHKTLCNKSTTVNAC